MHMKLFRIPVAGLVLALLLSFSARSQNTLFLTPQVKDVIIEEGSFSFDNKISVYVADANNKETAFAAANLVEELNADGKSDVSVTNNLRKADIILGITERDKAISKMLEKAGLTLPEKAREEGYILKITPGEIVVAAQTEAGLFYGVQTLKQLIRSNQTEGKLPLLTITDWPSLRYRGWMDDISRGPIPTVEFLKECIRKMSEFKQNFFTLYTEHTFRLEQYPDIAPADGLTKEEIAELTEYASKYHIDIIGNFQSFGHMAKILANPYYAHLGESSDILNPADESTYEFLKNIYAEVVPSYKSEFFNINCDETFGLGEGKSRQMAAEIGVDGIYAYHINRIDKLIKPYNKRIMMWGDIAVNNPGIINKLPKDLVILSWGYHAAESFDDAIMPFKNTGFDFMVAPGVSCWNEVWPGMNNAAINISNYVRDGYKLGAMGMMNTAWDDNGHNLFNSNWHGLVWGAECSWNPSLPVASERAAAFFRDDLNSFNQSFDKLFFGMEGVTDILLSIDSLRNLPVKGILNEWAFWQGPLDFNSENTTENAFNANQEILRRVDAINVELKAIKSRLPRQSNMVNNAFLALNRIAFTAHKNLLRIKLYKIKQTGDEKLMQEARSDIQKLTTQLHSIKKDYIKLWQNENRAWWLDKNLNDYNRLAESLDRIDDQVFIEPSVQIVDGEMPVTLSTLFNDKVIVYTLDGTEPSVSSEKYTAPLQISRNTHVKAAVLTDGTLSITGSRNILFHKGIGTLRKLHSRFSTYNPAYSAGGESGLLDGLKGSGSFYDGHWQGYQGQDLDIELDFGKVTPVNKVSVDFLQNAHSWILLPEYVEVLVSDDGINYRSAGLMKHEVPQNLQGTVIHNFSILPDKTSTRNLRLTARYPGPLPASHHAPGNPSFIFADEIVIE